VSATFLKIEGVEVFVCSDSRSQDYADLASPMDRYPRYRHSRPSWYRFMDRVLVAVHGDGLTGLGMTNGGGITGALVAEHIRPLLVGQELRDVEVLWGVVHDSMLPFGATGLARMALSAVDIALWDLLARYRQLPVYELLGGALKLEVPAYATTVDVVSARERGFLGAKVTASVGPWDPPHVVEEWLSRLEQERAAVGDAYPLMVDAWMGWDLEFALRMLPRLALLGIDWLEEPFPPADLTSYQAVASEAARHRIRIAAGEHHGSVLDTRHLLGTGAIQIVQPDVTWCGGITELRRIIDLASQARIPVCPHFGGEVWALHMIAASDNCQLAEWYVDDAQNIDITPGPRVSGAPRPKDGYLSLSDSPGFGVSIS